MKGYRTIAAMLLCLLLAGSTLAAADSDRGRGDRGQNTEEKSKNEKSRKHRKVQRRDERGGRRYVVENRREPSRTVRRTSERMVSRVATSPGWHNRALRGRAQIAAWDGHRARSWSSEHRTWRARGGYSGHRIPDYRYRAVFGPTHRFRVDRCPVVMVSGYPRFYYGGYWVTFIDPWPEYWPDYWFAQDDCYVVYMNDGYYLTNVRYPSVRIAVSFTLG